MSNRPGWFGRIKSKLSIPNIKNALVSFAQTAQNVGNVATNISGKITQAEGAVATLKRDFQATVKDVRNAYAGDQASQFVHDNSGLLLLAGVGALLFFMSRR